MAAKVIVLDRSSVATIVDEVGRILHDEENPRVIIHLGYASSNIFGALVAVRQQVMNWGGELRVVVDDEHIASMLRLTRIDRTLKVYESVEEAMEGLVS